MARTYTSPLAPINELPLTVYVFRDGFASSANTIVCVAEKGRIEEVFGKGQIKVLFYGEAVYTNDALKQDYLGVWGARNASRFRRLLREKGIDLKIDRARPPETRLRYFSTEPGARLRAASKLTWPRDN